MMQAPAFWSRPRNAPGLLPRLLGPLSTAWALETGRRLKRGAWLKMPVPVICVGNIVAGGTGKTPTVCAVLERLSQKGIAAHVVTRGYGGNLEGPVRVDLASHTSTQVGDEPLLLAAFAPTWVAKDREAGTRAAAEGGAGVVIFDDGFQNPSVHKDLSIVVIDAAAGFGNGRMIPAGPLREPLESGLGRADLLVTIGGDSDQHRLLEEWPEIVDRPRLKARIEPLATGMDWEGLPVFAFAGIGRPAKFFETLRDQGAQIVGHRSFPDHSEYPSALLYRLEAEAKANGAQLVTTEKDAVRLPADFRSKVLVLPVRLASDDWSLLDELLPV
jgi:tetraacyldisaccharide 4'-kinase